ncbi:lantibiotic dehydratase [Sphaerisporangium sp. NPDC051011]|uniref:lantibiotic dehydratase n=1 Tax=Sphaerisporangium sp. NPDC051011 TaxID=3155792 RepID=UPI003408A55E
MDAAVIRVAAYPDNLVLPPWPDLSNDDVRSAVSWIGEVWPLAGVADAVNIASPDLARVLTALCEAPGGFRPRQIRRAAEALMRYLLRWTSRATPFGLFAGLAPVSMAPTTSVAFGDRHVAVSQPDSTWLTDQISALENQPELLRMLPVMTNNLGFVRGADWVLPCQPCAEGPVADVSVRYTAAVRMVLQEARTSVLFGDLLAKLAAESPRTPVTVIEDMLTELVRRRILLTSVRPPMTVTDPLTHIAAQLAGLEAGPVSPVALDPSPRLAVGLRLDCSISLPPCVIGEVEAAAAILVRLAPGRPAWQAYHSAFVDRYGPGALVGIRELLDPDRGLGYPAGFRGSLYSSDPALTHRDATLAALAQRAALDGCAELVITEDLVAELEIGGAAGPVPHTELRVSLSAPTLAAVDAGEFTIIVMCASRHAGTSVGRFLHLLEAGDRDRISAVYRGLPATTAGAMAVQLSVPPLFARTDGLARTADVLPVLSLGEHRQPDSEIDLDDLAVTADARRLVLVSLTRGCAVEPLMLNALDLRHGVPPLARFLCEVSTGTSAPCSTFVWGPVADQFAFLPRVRYGRTVLSPARWNLTATTLPDSTATTREWVKAFRERLHSHHIPDVVRFGDDDVRIRLDLTESAHLALLRGHLDRVGRARLTEDGIDDGWIGGRPHEIVVPVASTTPPRPLARPLRPERIHQGPGCLPGASPWLYAKLFGHPARQSDLLTTFASALLADWDHGAPDDWWFIRYDAPAPHLRVRLRLYDSDRYGAAARSFGQWARTVHRAGLLRDVCLETYRPETGRFGTGPTLAAAEDLFAADSAVAVAQLRGMVNAPAATAAGLVGLATGFLGVGGPSWLVEHIAHGGGSALDRSVVEQARHPLKVPIELLDRWRKALSTYRALLDADTVNVAHDVNVVLADLLHLHHARMIGIDAESERTCMRLARAVAQGMIAQGERSGTSTSSSGPVTVPTT